MDGTREDSLGLLHKITVTNQFKASAFIWQSLILLGLLSYFIGFDQETFLVIFGFYGLFSIPAIYLHFEYLLNDIGKSIRIENTELIIIQNGETYKIKFAEFEKITVYKSASLDKGGIPLSPIESYHFARILTKSGEEITITCLLVSKVDDFISQIKGVRVERKKRPFCAVFWK